MSFAFIVLTGLCFGAAAVRTSRVVSLHLLAIWVYFSALPGLTTLVVASDTGLRDAMVQYGYLPLLYLSGVLAASLLMRDAATAAALLDRLRALRDDERGRQALHGLFVTVFATDIYLRWNYNILGSGTASDALVLELPYIVTTTLFITSELLFGLFCYACLTFRQSNITRLLVGAFTMYMLVSEGRRSFVLALIALVSLAGADFRFRVSPRILMLLTAAAALFVALSPVFLQFRTNLQTIQLTYGVSSAAAFPEAIKTTYASFEQGSTGILQQTSANVAERGNAGVFFFRVAQNIPFYQGGELTKVSLRWLVPSFVSAKPEAQTETVIQYASGLPLIDDANSIPAIFLADYGPMGVVVAGFMTALFLYAIARVVARPGRFGLLGIYLLGTLFARSFRIEGEFTEFLAFFRNVVIILAFDALWRVVAPSQLGMARPALSGHVAA